MDLDLNLCLSSSNSVNLGKPFNIVTLSFVLG